MIAPFSFRRLNRLAGLAAATLVKLLVTSLLLASNSASADDFVWTGKQYIPIPAHANQDIIITMPEPVVWNFQQPSLNQVEKWDERSILIRAKVAEQEQRVFFKGEKTGKTYYGKVSSRLPFVPLRNVIDGTAAAQEERVAAAGVTPLGLMKAMMLPNGIPPQGFDEQASQKVLLNMAPFRITANSVWTSPGLVGITATLTSTLPDATIPIVPTNFQIRVPEYGALRVMGADTWELTPTNISTRVYFVFAR